MRRLALAAAAALLVAGCGGITSASPARKHRPPTATPIATSGPTASPTAVPPGTEPPGVLPLPATTGALNPQVTDTNLAQTVCGNGGTGKYRPSQGYAGRVKHLELTTPVGQSVPITVTPADATSPGDLHVGRTYQVPGYRGYYPPDGDQPGNVELDHYIALSDGGDGYDPANLWPQPGGQAHLAVTGYDGGSANSVAKDGLEYYLYRELCGGRLHLADVQRMVTHDWYRQYVALGRPRGDPGSARQ